MENADKVYKLLQKGCKHMQNELGTSEDVLTTKEACSYLRISRPTYLKYLSAGRIKGVKTGKKGWKVRKFELNRLLKGELKMTPEVLGREERKPCLSGD